MKEGVSHGTWIEFVYNGLIGAYKEFEFADYARAIRTVGIDKCVLHWPGKEGFTPAEIDLMSKTNPALILGLD